MSDERAKRQTTGTRGADGKFTRTLKTAERDAEAARLRGRGWSYRRIGAELGIEVSNAYAAVQRALEAVVTEAAEEVRKVELERLDEMYTAVLAVLEREHVTVSQGKVVGKLVDWERDSEGVVILNGDGKPIGIYEDVPDDAPVLQAIDRLLKIQERRAKLLGLDAPTKAEIGGQLTYEVVGVDDGAL